MAGGSKRVRFHFTKTPEILAKNQIRLMMNLVTCTIQFLVDQIMTGRLDKRTILYRIVR